MRNYLLLLIAISFILCNNNISAQNVGIGQTSPEAQLHVTPPSGQPSLKIDGLNLFTNTDSSFLMLDQVSGLVKYAPISHVLPLLTPQVENGLNIDPVSSKIRIGGDLIMPTIINQAQFNMIYNLNGFGQFLVQDNGVTKFAVLDNGRVAIGSNATSGSFNVTGNSYFSDDIFLRKTSVTGLRLARIYDDQNAGAIELYNNGQTKIEFNAGNDSYILDGNFGIGTDNPSEKLHIDGSAQITNLSGVGDRMVVANATGVLNTQAIPTIGDLNSLTDVNTAPNNGEALVFNGTEWVSDVVGGSVEIITGDGLTGTNNNDTINLQVIAQNGITANADNIELGGPLTQNTTITNGSFDLNINLNSFGDFKVQNNGNDRFVMNRLGNSTFTGDLILRDNSINGTALFSIFDSGDDGVINIFGNGVVANRIHGSGNSYINGGNLGLGTTVPSQKLHIVGNARISDLAGTGNRMVIADLNGDFTTEDFYINGGNLGLGTPSPSQKLHVVGNARITDLAGVGNRMVVANLNGDLSTQAFSSSTISDADGDTEVSTERFPDNDVITFYNKGLKMELQEEIFRVNTDRTFFEEIVGIGIYPNGYQLQLSLNLAAKPLSSAWAVSSDRRLKKDINAFEDGLDLIKKINPVWFTYNGKAGMPQETGVGTIAQELEKIAPYMVKDWTYENEKSGEKESYLAVDYGALDFVLVNAVQEQQTIIEGQDKELKKLKSEMKAMKKAMQEIKALLSSETKALEN